MSDSLSSSPSRSENIEIYFVFKCHTSSSTVLPQQNQRMYPAMKTSTSIFFPYSKNSTGGYHFVLIIFISINDEHDWRSGMRVKLLKRVAMYNQRRQAWRGPDNEKKVVGQASNQTRDHDRKVIGQTSNRTRDEEKHMSIEHQDDILDEERFCKLQQNPEIRLPSVLHQNL